MGKKVRSLSMVKDTPNGCPAATTGRARGERHARWVAAACAAVAAWCLLMSAPAQAVPTPAQKCQAGKNRAAGTYAGCLQKAEAGRVTTGNLTKYTNAVATCGVRFQKRWQTLINIATKAGATCPDAPLTNGQFGAVINDHSDNISTALGGGGLNSCQNDLPQCQSDLAACLSSTLPAARLLKTGQGGCYDSNGTGIACAGTGQDGELQKGQVRSYTDNGDGTITDNQTGLTWEKKSDDDSIHDKDAVYTWDNAFSFFIADLNTTNFAGHNDWRLPNETELQSLIDFGALNPAVDSVFNNNCGPDGSGNPGCLVANCSCTEYQNAGYWASTSAAANPVFAWNVFFNLGITGQSHKSLETLHVRAVRGGV
jgi:hypothetical protein